MLLFDFRCVLMCSSAGDTATNQGNRDMYNDINIRIENAEANLIEALRNAGANDYAEEVAAYYINEKIVKLDMNIGRYKFTHGAFLDEDVIERAIELVA